MATNLASADSFGESSLYFGVVVDGQWTTPALGVQSVVSINLDTNLDKKVDYVVQVEPFSSGGPF
ncbi:MAG: hypothetical protein EOO75_10435, partial [Myxococcales bacterium]